MSKNITEAASRDDSPFKRTSPDCDCPGKLVVKPFLLLL
jgi:hypothetical protein